MILKKEALEKLKLRCNHCKACELNNTRHNAVFADGNPKTASVVLIGEAPGENEDLQGIPFVGRAGKLLDEFLNEAGLSRGKDLYIINTVKCRPPKNRVPTNAEKVACRRFLLEQIEIIAPKIILLCGATALKSFYNGKSTISKIRGEVFDVEINGKKYPVMPIFHPSYLLRNHSTAEGSPRYLMLNDLKKVYLKIKLLDR
ncbi:MAG: uracil-DNA glycosylase [bacterium]